MSSSPEGDEIFVMELPAEPVGRQRRTFGDLDVESCNDECEIFNLDYFHYPYWLPIVATEQGKLEYHEFIGYILKWIRSNDASVEAAYKFFVLIDSNTEFDSTTEFDFLGPACSQMPELDHV